MLELYGEQYVYYKIRLLESKISAKQINNGADFTTWYCKNSNLGLEVKGSSKIRHLIWQTISGQLAMTINFTHCHMQCDKHGSRCGAKDETINHAIFEYAPAFTNMVSSSNPHSTIDIL